MAGRAGVAFSLDDFDAISRRVPVLANLRPSGEYLMEDFYYAGGLQALLHELATGPRRLASGPPDRPGGRTIGEHWAQAAVHNRDVIRHREDPCSAEGGLAVLRGNLAPDGAVIKYIASRKPSLLKHTGPAVVFDSYAELRARIDDPAHALAADSVLVLRNAGPIGGPGMPEYGMLPIPRYLLEAGVTDLVRISDARMSGTSTAPACCMSPPSRTSAARSPSSIPGIRSRSMSKPGP